MMTRLLITLSLGALAACAPTGSYTWVNELPPSVGASESGILQSGDTVNVRVMPDERFSTHEKIRPDGTITLPMAGDIMARGRRLGQLATDIQERLKPTYLNAPVVTVTYELGADMKVSVLGEVKTANVVQLDHGANVLDALAAAGGLTEYADSDRIFVIRSSLPQRVRFRYSDLRAGDLKSNEFVLRPGDKVVVE